MTIKEYCEKTGMSLNELSKKLYVSRSYLTSLANNSKDCALGESIVERFREVAPEITIHEETIKVYKVY